MAKTQSERFDEIGTKLELLVTQQRVIINQHDKILEFVDAIYQASVQTEAAQAPPEEAEVPESVAEIIRQLKGEDDEKEPYFGYKREQELKAREEAQNGD